MRHLLLEEGNEPFNPGSSAWNEKAPRPVNVQAGRRSLYSSLRRRKFCRWKLCKRKSHERCKSPTSAKTGSETQTLSSEVTDVVLFTVVGSHGRR
jgi:hypothetical protein